MLFPFSRSDSISDAVFGISSLIPQLFLRWNFGVHNFMTYATGDIPVGSYSSTPLSNIGIGHGAVDAGGGYTYFNPETGHELSGVLGFTYNFKNPYTQYKNGVYLHFDWGASQFVSKEVQIGVVGYAYKDIGCDSVWRSGRLLPVSGYRHRSTDRVCHTPRGFAGVSKFQRLRSSTLRIALTAGTHG